MKSNIALSLTGAFIFSLIVLSQAPTARASNFGFDAKSWDWQLSGKPNLSRNVDVIDVDPGDVSAKDIAELKRRGIKTICYTSVGTLENFRDDVASFPKEVIGKVNADWPDERYLDIRALSKLLPIMRRRFEKCSALGFDAVEPDNIDVHVNESGFPITADDVVVYATRLADIAHLLDLKIAHKNAPDLSARLSATMDFVIAESCLHKNSCSRFQHYFDANKAVFDAEYIDTDVDFTAACQEAKRLGIKMVLKDRDLTDFAVYCRDKGITVGDKPRLKLAPAIKN